MKDNWKEDPRIKGMNSEKLDYLAKLAKKLEDTPQAQLMTAFMAVSMEAKSSGIQFTDQETELLVSILTAHMTPEEKNRFDTLKMLSKNMAK